MNDQLAEEIFDKFDMKLSKKGVVTYKLIDRNNKDTPIVVIDRHGPKLEWWRAYVEYQLSTPLCEFQRTRKRCVAMAQYKLANYMVELKRIEDALNA